MRKKNPQSRAKFENPNAMFGLGLHGVIQQLHHHVATRKRKLGAHEDRYSCPYLHAVHDVTVAAIKGEVVPRPISDSANFVAPAQ